MLITVSRLQLRLQFFENKISKFQSTDWIKNSIFQISFNTNYLVFINRAFFLHLTYTQTLHQLNNTEGKKKSVINFPIFTSSQSLLYSSTKSKSFREKISINWSSIRSSINKSSNICNHRLLALTKAFHFRFSTSTAVTI